ncbi:hypothetical protein TRAPUB_3821 [Trametes pubescens]|uniref:Uncharacterized protein n=1 Tax=Trametes pubescens TaxID=154538 RepID=A0A1M2VCM1_TRAPU|nr:hypothetical protein TRAPUB_3821 [Trametes pubescens]
MLGPDAPRPLYTPDPAIPMQTNYHDRRRGPEWIQTGALMTGVCSPIAFRRLSSGKTAATARRRTDTHTRQPSALSGSRATSWANTAFRTNPGIHAKHPEHVANEEAAAAAGKMLDERSLA